MSKLAGGLVLVMGVGFVAVALQGLVRGWLPNGPNGYKRGEGVHRDRQPLGFWFFFALYLAVGLYIAYHAVGMMSGAGRPGG
jgi:hypothetical protein